MLNPKTQLSGIAEIARQVITNPAGFFKNMPKTGGFADPVLFVAVMAFASGLLIAVLSIIGFSIPGMAGVGLTAIIMVPIFAVIGSFIGAGVMFVIWKLIGSEQNYETAYRCIAYSAAIYPIGVLLNLVPYLGAIAATAWGFYLIVIASIEVHAIKKQTAYITFGILGALFILMNLSAQQQAAKFEDYANQYQESGQQQLDAQQKAILEMIKNSQQQ